ncbi:hypothetical protein F5Y01DRAFT_153537 [Xylaria sp. FL0043]|nr:hypothetical protein F5Y01DRAFT_153537 [Xylaria sp. FL0043]
MKQHQFWVFLSIILASEQATYFHLRILPHQRAARSVKATPLFILLYVFPFFFFFSPISSWQEPGGFILIAFTPRAGLNSI